MIDPLEMVANLVVTMSIFLAGRNSLHTWWTGIVGCALFGVLFFRAQLYADVVLQLFFLVTSAIGWWQWQSGRLHRARPITHASKHILLTLAPLGILVAAGYGLLLHRFTDAYAPFVDSGVLVFSVIAQFLLMQRRLQCWWFWLLVNSIAVPLYASRELYLTAGLYACYWINALVAYRHWKKQMARDIPSQTKVLGHEFT